MNAGITPRTAGAALIALVGVLLLAGCGSVGGSKADAEAALDAAITDQLGPAAVQAMSTDEYMDLANTLYAAAERGCADGEYLGVSDPNVDVPVTATMAVLCPDVEVD